MKTQNALSSEDLADFLHSRTSLEELEIIRTTFFTFLNQYFSNAKDLEGILFHTQLGPEHIFIPEINALDTKGWFLSTWSQNQWISKLEESEKSETFKKEIEKAEEAFFDQYYKAKARFGLANPLQPQSRADVASYETRLRSKGKSADAEVVHEAWIKAFKSTDLLIRPFKSDAAKIHDYHQVLQDFDLRTSEFYRSWSISKQAALLLVPYSHPTEEEAIQTIIRYRDMFPQRDNVNFLFSIKRCYPGALRMKAALKRPLASQNKLILFI